MVTAMMMAIIMLMMAVAKFEIVRLNCHLRRHLAISIHGSRHSRYDSNDVDDDRHEECKRRSGQKEKSAINFHQSDNFLRQKKDPEVVGDFIDEEH